MTRYAAAIAILILAATPATAQVAGTNNSEPRDIQGASPAAQMAPGPSETTAPAAAESRQATPGGQSAVQPGEQAAQGLWDRSNLFGELGGLRSRLAERGITFGLAETMDVFGNPTGGVRQGVIYEGLTLAGVGVDTEKLFGLKGGTFNVTGYQIHGRGLSFNNLGNNLNTVSSLEAPRGTLLFELWYEQVLFDKKVAVRVGQLAADQEFMISQYGGLFTNHTFGWNTLASTDLPSGGPAYPLAAAGVRVKYVPRDDLSLLLGVFNGDPAGPGRGIPQDRDTNGTAFRLRDGVFLIAEAQYGLNQGEGAGGLPGTYKAGAYYNSQNFADQRRTGDGTSLANLAATDAIGRNRRGSYGLYAVADQLVYRETGTKDQGAAVFLRFTGAPGDRNLVNFYVDAGVTYKGVVPGRNSDTLGLGFALARISDTAAKLDSDTARLNGGATPIRRHESVLELTYQAQIAPWWQVQPTAQYVFNLNGGVQNPLQPAKRLPDAAVLGLRTTVTF
ncbi:MAG: carbohydrate porin [Janthinobacterium lividum]